MSKPGQVIAQDGCEGKDVHLVTETTPRFKRFDTGLTAEGRNRVANAVRIITNSNLTADIIGHADKCGSNAEDMRLSEMRAQRVAKELYSMGIDKNMIARVEGRGHTKGLSETPREGLIKAL